MKKLFQFLGLRKTGKAPEEHAEKITDKDHLRKTKGVSPKSLFKKELYRDDNDLGYC